jgi:hypothetical protein
MLKQRFDKFYKLSDSNAIFLNITYLKDGVQNKKQVFKVILIEED